MFIFALRVKFLTMSKIFNLQGVIGENVHAISLAAFLDALNAGDKATIVIDSVGGYVHEGELMAEAIELAESRGVKVTTKAIFVASAANLPFLAASQRVATEGLSKFMIHNCWSEVRGNASELAKVAAEQSEIDNRMRSYYEKRTGKNATFFQKYMDSDSEFGADTAALLGFVTQTEKMKAMAMLSAPASKTDTDDKITSNLINSMNKEKTILDKIRGIFKAAGEQLPEGFPKEKKEEEAVDAPADVTALMAKLDECMNRIAAIESKLAGTETEMDKCKEATEKVEASLTEVSNGVVALASAVAKASKGAVKATVLPSNDKVPTQVGKTVLENDDFINKISEKHKLVN